MYSFLYILLDQFDPFSANEAILKFIELKMMLILNSLQL